MRTNRNGVTENSEFKIDRPKYQKEHQRIFGETKQEFCSLCDKRFSYCECDPVDVKANEVEEEYRLETKQNGETTTKEQNDQELYKFNSATRKTQHIFNELKEWKDLAQESSDELATLRAEIKEDMAFVLSLATYCTQQTAVKIEEIKKKYL